MATDGTETSVNIPQLAVLLVIGFLAVRWILTSSRPDDGISSTTTTSTTTTSSGRATNNSNNAASLRHVETISAMFPQLDRRTILWDLQRNGNNVQMTTERVLSGRTLETPPQTFQPVLPDLPPTSTTSAAQSQPKKPSQPDLIQRYNLATRLQDSEEISDSSQGSKGGSTTSWAGGKADRQSTLQKKREEMILAARRKMMEKK